MLIGQTLRNSAIRSPDKSALIWREARLTYRQLDQQANQLANVLIDLDLGQDAKVAILSGNRPEYVIAYFAIARTNYVSVHCSTRSSAEELIYVLDKVQAEILFVESQYFQILDDVLPALGRPIKIFLFDSLGVEDKRKVDAVHINQLISSGSTGSPDVERTENDSLAITFTGGTTGVPKAVLVSHGARYATATASAEDFDISEHDVILASTPLFHTVGLFVWVGTAVMLGATIALQDAWNPTDFIQIVKKEKVTAAFLVPSQLNGLITDPTFSAAALTSLRNIGYAGAPMARALFDRVQAALPHVEFIENYGQSEACPITIRSKGDGLDKLGTVGKPAMHTEIGIVDREGKFLPPNTVGDIVTRGETVFSEYFGDKKETGMAFAVPGGWLLTGDVGFLDNDGFLTLMDRSKDMLISGGENVYPAEIENALYQHPAVVECAVFGIPNDQWGEVPAACVVLAAGAEVSADQLIDFCATKIARFKRPRQLEFVEKLPKTAVGKIRKNILRDPYWAGMDKKI